MWVSNKRKNEACNTRKNRNGESGIKAAYPGPWVASRNIDQQLLGFFCETIVRA